MRKKSLYPRLAGQNIIKNRRFFVPYALTVLGTSAAFYIMSALVFDPGAKELRGYQYVQSMMVLGMFIAGLFTAAILFYTNSFLMKQRRRELGLYNILGMGKGNLARLLCYESLFIGGGGIVSGLLVGMLFHKLVTLFLYQMLRFDVPFGITISVPAIVLTAVIFALLVLATLVVNLLRIRVSSPVQMLQSTSQGEREPRTKWLMTLVGILSLGAGYWIAITADDPISALAMYFLAVFLVILGTYCLFTAVSISVLKLLRANKKFYYQTSHFIGISGMLYRMKRNAVGLANICILSTMVMVMVSGTLSLYLGTGEIIDAQYPADVNLTAQYDPLTTEEGEAPFQGQPMLDRSVRALQDAGFAVADTDSIRYATFAVQQAGTGKFVLDFETDLGSDAVRRTIYFISADTYTALTGEASPTLAEGEVVVCGGESLPDTITFRDGEMTATYQLAGRVAEIPMFFWTPDEYEPICFVVGSEAAVDEAYAMQHAAYANPYDMCWRGLIQIEGGTSEADVEALDGVFWGESGLFAGPMEDVGYYYSLSVDLKAAAEADGYAMAGGFLFLGIVLGVIFLMATVLIIYYKQVSEGYEDRRRFEIMQQVGLTRAEVRASIRSQVLMVFFLPIAVAAIHILFDFNMVVQLLELFSLRNVLLTALCTLDTVLVFFIVYGAVYLLTARTYYKIVS